MLFRNTFSIASSTAVPTLGSYTSYTLVAGNDTRTKGHFFFISTAGVCVCVGGGVIYLLLVVEARPWRNGKNQKNFFSVLKGDTVTQGTTRGN